MGWTVFSTMPRGGMKAAVDRSLGGADGRTVVASELGSDGNVYAAVKVPSGDVVAAIGLIEGCGYKLMSEAEGPYYYACPPAILEKLTPTTHPYALKWRARVAEGTTYYAKGYAA
jgi:hypothetical protein